MYMVGGGAGEVGEVRMVVNVGNESEYCSVGGSALMSAISVIVMEDLSHWDCECVIGCYSLLMRMRMWVAWMEPFVMAVAIGGNPTN